jgi:hypothetical protein
MRSRNLKELSEAKTQAILEKFAQWRREHPSMRWPDALRRLAPRYGLATRDLLPVDREAARILARAKRVFAPGRELRPPAKGPRGAVAILQPDRRKAAS